MSTSTLITEREQKSKKQRNNNKSHRPTIENERKTQEVILTFEGKRALSDTWNDPKYYPERQHLFNTEHDYRIALNGRVRNVKNYLLHRSDAHVDLG